MPNYSIIQPVRTRTYDESLAISRKQQAEQMAIEDAERKQGTRAMLAEIARRTGGDPAAMAAEFARVGDDPDALFTLQQRARQAEEFGQKKEDRAFTIDERNDRALIRDLDLVAKVFDEATSVTDEATFRQWESRANEVSRMTGKEIPRPAGYDQAWFDRLREKKDKLGEKFERVTLPSGLIAQRGKDGRYYPMPTDPTIASRAAAERASLDRASRERIAQINAESRVVRGGRPSANTDWYNTLKEAGHPDSEILKIMGRAKNDPTRTAAQMASADAKAAQKAYDAMPVGEPPGPNLLEERYRFWRNLFEEGGTSPAAGAGADAAPEFEQQFDPTAMAADALPVPGQPIVRPSVGEIAARAAPQEAGGLTAGQQGGALPPGMPQEVIDALPRLQPGAGLRYTDPRSGQPITIIMGDDGVPRLRQ